MTSHLRGRLRSAFTLVELLIAITVISILSGLVYGALQRASVQSKAIHTRSTISKLNASVVDRWESYRTRRVNLDPINVAQGMKAGYYATAFQAITAMASRRIANSNGAMNFYPTVPYDPLSVPINAGTFPTSAQLAAIRLLALREIQQYEMPNAFSDFADMSGTPGSFKLRQPNVLMNYVSITDSVQNNIPGLAFAYLAALNKATTTDVNQITANESAECLYMMLTFGSSDNLLAGEHPVPPGDIGDVDGDGLLEFQDAWPSQNLNYPTTARANNPISWIRWPAGYYPSDTLPDPNLPTPSQFSLGFHDYLDPLKLDIPLTAVQDPPAPRGYRLVPLIYSAGPDGLYEMFTTGTSSDPYDNGASTSTPGLAGSWQDSNLDGKDQSIDNITNQDIADK